MRELYLHTSKTLTETDDGYVLFFLFLVMNTAATSETPMMAAANTRVLPSNPDF